MNGVEEIKKKNRNLKLKQKMTTSRLEWNDIQREIENLYVELKQIDTDNPQYGMLIMEWEVKDCFAQKMIACQVLNVFPNFLFLS